VSCLAASTNNLKTKLFLAVKLLHIYILYYDLKHIAEGYRYALLYLMAASYVEAISN